MDCWICVKFLTRSPQAERSLWTLVWYFAKCGFKKWVRPSIQENDKILVRDSAIFWVKFGYFGNFPDILQKLPVITSWFQCFFGKILGTFPAVHEKDAVFGNFMNPHMDCWICVKLLTQNVPVDAPPKKEQSSKNEGLDSLGPACSN